MGREGDEIPSDSHYRPRRSGVGITRNMEAVEAPSPRSSTSRCATTGSCSPDPPVGAEPIRPDIVTKFTKRLSAGAAGVDTHLHAYVKALLRHPGHCRWVRSDHGGWSLRASGFVHHPSGSTPTPSKDATAIWLPPWARHSLSAYLISRPWSLGVAVRRFSMHLGEEARDRYPPLSPDPKRPGYLADSDQSVSSRGSDPQLLGGPGEVLYVVGELRSSWSLLLLGRVESVQQLPASTVQSFVLRSDPHPLS